MSEDAPRLCDFCGRFAPLTIEARETARIICSTCVWQCADALTARAAAVRDSRGEFVVDESAL